MPEVVSLGIGLKYRQYRFRPASAKRESAWSDREDIQARRPLAPRVGRGLRYEPNACSSSGGGLRELAGQSTMAAVTNTEQVRNIQAEISLFGRILSGSYDYRE